MLDCLFDRSQCAGFHIAGRKEKTVFPMFYENIPSACALSYCFTCRPDDVSCRKYKTPAPTTPMTSSLASLSFVKLFRWFITSFNFFSFHDQSSKIRYETHNLTSNVTHYYILHIFNYKLREMLGLLFIFFHSSDIQFYGIIFFFSHNWRPMLFSENI